MQSVGTDASGKVMLYKILYYPSAHARLTADERNVRGGGSLSRLQKFLQMADDDDEEVNDRVMCS